MHKSDMSDLSPFKVLFKYIYGMRPKYYMHLNYGSAPEKP